MVKSMTLSRKKNTDEFNPKYQKIESSGRAEGDRWVYYFFHTMIGALFFLPISIYFGLFSTRTGQIEDLFTMDFLYLLLIVFGISLGTSILARILAYKLIKKIYISETKSIWEFNNKGMNKIGMRWIVASFVTSLLFVVGAVVILQNRIFNTTEDEIISLILAYLIIKFAVFIFTKIFVDTKG